MSHPKDYHFSYKTNGNVRVPGRVTECVSKYEIFILLINYKILVLIMDDLEFRKGSVLETTILHLWSH